MNHPHPLSKTPWDPPRLEDVQYTHLKENARSLSSPFYCTPCPCLLPLLQLLFTLGLGLQSCLHSIVVLTSLVKY